MTDIETIGHELAETLKKYSADYIEARLEESQISHITYRGKELESIGRSTAIGGNIRALVKGGWGFISFNNLDELPGRVATAVKQAQLVGGEEIKLAPVEPVIDKVGSGIERDPVTIPLAEKKQLLDDYNAIIWRTPQIQTSTIGYADSHKKVIFLNSLGSNIAQERADINLRLAAIAARDSEVQQVGLSMGSRGDFGAIQGLHQR